MKLAVTGGTGHLGASLLPLLINQGHDVTALVRSDSPGLSSLNVKLIKGDLSDENSLHELMRGNEVIIHCAAKISITGDEAALVQEINVGGTTRVVKIAKEEGLRKMIHISSIHAFNQFPTDTPLNEIRDYVSEDAFAYDRSKRDATKVALGAADKNFEVITLHPTSIIGPPDYKPSLLGSAIINFLSGSIPFATTGGFDFVDVRDLSQAIANAVTMGRSGERYLVSGKYCPVATLFSMMQTAAGKKSRMITVPIWVAEMGIPFEKIISKMQHRPPLFTKESMTALRTCNRFIDASKAKNELAYTIRPMEETANDLVNWFQQYGYLAKQ